jgi:hypothetical protein
MITTSKTIDNNNIWKYSGVNVMLINNDNNDKNIENDLDIPIVYTNTFDLFIIIPYFYKE